MKNKFKNIIILYIMLMAVLNCTLVAKNKKDMHPEGGTTLTLVNETSFTLYFPDEFYPSFDYKSLSEWRGWKSLLSGGYMISDLLPTMKYTKDFGDLNYGAEGTHFRVLSYSWPRGKELIVQIPKPEGPNFAPFWDEEHELFNETIAIDYNVKWSDDENGWVVTFFEEERFTAVSSKGPSPEVEALRNRIKLKDEMKSQVSQSEL